MKKSYPRSKIAVKRFKPSLIVCLPVERIWVAILVGVLIGVVFILGFIIKYPDTVDGQITITARFAPVRLVANSSGKMHLLIANNNKVTEGEVIGYIESGTNYIDVLKIDSLLSVYEIDSIRELSVSTALTLGEISSAFTAFMIAHRQYCRFLASDIYRAQSQNLRLQIDIDKKIIKNMSQEAVLKRQILLISQERTIKDSMLVKAKAISEEKYLHQYTEFLSQKDNYESFNSEKMSRKSQLYQNELELQLLKMEKQETGDRLLTDLLARKNELCNMVRIWKEKYLQYAPIEGDLEFLGFWRENGYVQIGQELFSIIPSRDKMQGEVLIPARGVGKIKVGQTANVKVENYPYDEYGLIKGEVQSISRLAHKVQVADGANTNAYRVMISFPQGLQTNFGKDLMLDFESIGSVEIITKSKRLIERLFDNLKAKIEK